MPLPHSRAASDYDKVGGKAEAARFMLRIFETASLPPAQQPSREAMKQPLSLASYSTLKGRILRTINQQQASRGLADLAAGALPQPT